MESEQNDQNNLATGGEQDSLEAPSTIVEGNAAPTGEASPSEPAPQPPSGPSWWRRLAGRFNIYLLLFCLVLVIAVIIVVVAYVTGQHSNNAGSLSSQNLSASTLAQLANSDATVGNSNTVLNVQSSAIFAGKVLVRQDLEVAGGLQVGGTLSLNALDVAGTSQFGQVQINQNLSVAGNSGLQGSLTVAKSLQVNGSGSFNGTLSAPQITSNSLQLNGDLVLTHHLSAGGATPGRSNGTALGSGGTSSVSGSDTSGSITINTGSNPAAGCFVTINFAARYNATPHVLVTPVGSAAGGLSYYVNRSTSSFSVCTNSPAPAGATFGFDYFVVD